MGYWNVNYMGRIRNKVCFVLKLLGKKYEILMFNRDRLNTKRVESYEVILG